MWIASAARDGPTPVPQAVARCKAILEQLHADRRSQALALRPLATLYAMCGRMAEAQELIARADAIVYDRLIPPGALDGARPDAELHYVGKQPGSHAMAQEDINALLVELAARGLDVVRLKGGDPFVFGRGGEEARALAEAGVPFEVVPGVTAGVAAPAPRSPR